MRPHCFLPCLVAIAHAGWWDDFSNNLASDLAPILALFGEQVTKQFLSESTTMLDTFVFAMMPLGILTAVVSAIRVGGGPSLRAFIGRAQEGGGVAEAELCSSTSRDVCELYHNGAVVRVFGRPKIAELVHEPRDASFYEKLGSHGGVKDDVAAKCGIYTFQEYIASSVARDAGWTENGAPVGGGAEDGSDRTMKFAPNPNLSLNYGIKKHPKLVNWLAAFAGLVLQVSVFWFGALATYKWRWKKNDSLAPPWAFPMMIFGTVLQCSGMWWCAHLVGVSSKERVFRKRETTKHSPSSLHVVQPGNQVVGDQTLDSFSFQDAILPNREYITSWKDPQQSDHPKTTTASVAVTLVGFVLQFVSLRAMHSAVSVFQLGAILAMSLIRSMLRTQRLKREQNLLYNRPDEVQGYELDWLALQMEQSRNNGGLGLSTPLYYNTSTNTISTDTGARSSSGVGTIQILESWAGGVESACAITYSGLPPSAPSKVEEEIMTKHVEWLKQNECPDDSGLPHPGVRLFYCRARLAELTSTPRLPSPGLSNAWGDELVKSRSLAFQLKSAIEASADILFSRASVKSTWEKAHVFTWSTSNLSWCPGSSDQPRESRIHLSLKRSLVAGSKFSAWRTEQNFLEAVIGLSTWSIISDPLAETTDSFENTISAAAEVHTEHIWAVDTHAERLLQIEAEMKFWMEDFPVSTSHRKFGLVPRTTQRSPATIWSDTTGGTLVPVFWPCDRRRENVELVRFFGLQALRQPHSTNGQGISALTTRTRYSLTTLCAHEVYHSFMCGAAEALESVGGTLSISFGRDGLFLQNDVISKLVDCFEGSGLGSRQDAYPIIVSALRNRGKLQFGKDRLPDIINTAENYKISAEYEKAEEILQWAWNTTLQMSSDPLERVETTSLATVMLELGELYRPHMYSSAQKLQSFARNGLDWMRNTRATQSDFPTEVFEVMDRYLELSVKPACGYIPPVQEIIDAISSKDRVQALWLLSQKGVERLDAGSGGRTVLSWAAQQGWREVVKAALAMGHDLDADDHSGRTALSYAAEQGQIDIVERLMSHSAVPISEDRSGRNPLSYAASGGFVAAIEILMKDRRVSVYTRDGDGRSPLHFAAEEGRNETIKFLLQGSRAGMVNEAAQNGITPLYCALLRDHKETVELLIREGANWDVRFHGDEPWRWALRYGHWACVEFALGNLNRERMDGQKLAISVVVAPGDCSVDELVMATGEGRGESLTERGGLFLSEVGETGNNEVTISLESVAMVLDGKVFGYPFAIDRVEGHLRVETLETGLGKQKIVELLARHMGGNFYVTEEMLKVIARNCDSDEETVEWLLSWRDGEAELTEQVVELAIGRKMGALSLMKLFVEKRGDAVPVSDAALKLAASSGDEEVLRFIQDRLKRAIPADMWQTLALYQAVDGNDGKRIQRLLDQGADPNYRSRRGWMPIHHAVTLERSEAVRVLAAWPTVDVETWDERGCSALYHASCNDATTGIAEILLEAGADPCRPVKGGQTPMSRAKSFRRSGVVELFERYTTRNSDEKC